ncbi:MAG: VWA domain-containing protein [Lentisphaeria bacterium]|nr:VWA domain-containing protein [Lentisphaeria bacterium]
MNIDDPRITAYALNELQGQEKIDFEKELEQYPEILEEIEIIRAFTGELSDELQQEEILELSEEIREVILNEAKPISVVNFRRRWVQVAAAVVVVACIGIWFANQAPPEPKTVVLEMEHKVNLSTELSQDSEVSEPSLLKDTVAIADSLNEHSADMFAPSIPSRNMPRAKAKKESSIPAYKPTEADISYSIAPSMPKPNPPVGEKYGKYQENNFATVLEKPLSTFSIDVDTASYSNVRSRIMQGYLPNPDSVRIEELINYFHYQYQNPKKGHPFSTSIEVADSPWSEGNKLIRIGLQGKVIKNENRPQSNLVFLLDVSGSMSDFNKLPLLKLGLMDMVMKLNEKDHVGIVVYAGSAGVVLQPTRCDEAGKEKVLEALTRLQSGGSTNGEGGIREAYRLVEKNFIKGGTNRVILATDGDFNVGTSNRDELVKLVKQKAKSKAYLTVLGFGHGNLNDYMMEEISNQGNGNYFFIDNAKESTRVLCQKISGTLVTIAKDVKIQVEFNPALIHSYRLVGYDNLKLRDEDFNDDKKDAGEIGAGHQVTAIYEIVPKGSANAKPNVDALKYQTTAKVDTEQKEKVKENTKGKYADELMTVKLRYKSPEGGPSSLMTFPLKNTIESFKEASPSLRFATSVAAYGMLLKQSQFAGDVTYSSILEWIEQIPNLDDDQKEFLRLVKRTKELN